MKTSQAGMRCINARPWQRNYPRWGNLFLLAAGWTVEPELRNAKGRGAKPNVPLLRP
jgi:hypothetical protein